MTKKPHPTIDSDSQNYWKGAKSEKLMLQYCKESDEYFLYSRNSGQALKDDKLEWREVSGLGEIYSFTEVHVPAGEAFKDDIPYIVVLIKLKEGARIISNLVVSENERINIGAKVKVYFDKISPELTIPKFKLIK